MSKPKAARVSGICAAALITVGALSARSETVPAFSLPIDCAIGENCFIQSYVDIDPGPSARDYRCGGDTYDGHDGVDFRLLSAAAARGVAVRAAAPGVIKGARDGMPDSLVDDGNRQSVAGRECGNGVVIDHGDGWETQYCHMRRGSLRAKVGDQVPRGQPLGEVGYSGLAQFAHVHFAVRHNGAKIDPFTRRSIDGACSTSEDAGGGLWDKAAKVGLAYRAGQIFQSGFAEVVPQLTSMETSSSLPPPTASSEALIFFARFLNLRAGDRFHLIVHGPEGVIAENASEPLQRNKATYLAYAGKRNKSGKWPQGVYRGRVEILRDADVVAHEDRSFVMP